MLYYIYIVPVCSRSRGMFPHFCGGYHMIRCGGFLVFVRLDSVILFFLVHFCFNDPDLVMSRWLFW